MMETEIKKAMIIYNPSSGEKNSATYISELFEKLSDHFQQITIMKTEKAGDALLFSRQASLEAYHSLFLMGGDGTINEGFNGISDQEHRPKVGVIPLGTTNNFARMLGINLDPLKAIAQYSDYQIKKIDIGKVNDQFFMSTLSAGAVPESVQDVSPEMKERFGSLAYFIDGIQALEDQKTMTFKMIFDDEASVEEDFSMLVIGIGNSIYGVKNFFAEAEIDDGHLHLMGLRKSSFSEQMKLIPQLLKDSPVNSEFLFRKSFQKATILIESDQEHMTTVDGDTGPVFPIQLKIYPEYIEMYTFWSSN